MGYDSNDERGRFGGYGGGYRDDRRPRSPLGRDPRNDDSGFAYGAPRDYRVRRDEEERGFFERAGDEVRSWFGDEDAERRRERDTRDDDRSYNRFRTQDRNYRGGGTGYGDPGYHDWRQRQIDALDRDYDEYRREHQSKFDTEFGSWRTSRQTQRSSLDRVSEHQEVVGSDGQHVGTVDKVKGDRILLTKTDKDAGGHHHSIPSRWITSVDDKVTIAKTADEARRAWRDEERGALFGDRQRDDANGPHMLNRSFSGTY